MKSLKFYCSTIIIISLLTACCHKVVVVPDPDPGDERPVILSNVVEVLPNNSPPTYRLRDNLDSPPLDSSYCLTQDFIIDNSKKEYIIQQPITINIRPYVGTYFDSNILRALFNAFAILEDNFINYNFVIYNNPLSRADSTSGIKNILIKIESVISNTGSTAGTICCRTVGNIFDDSIPFPIIYISELYQNNELAYSHEIGHTLYLADDDNPANLTSEKFILHSGELMDDVGNIMGNDSGKMIYKYKLSDLIVANDLPYAKKIK
ncbi:MAG: hypothetical protein H7X99_05090 [Saprospiraceae bacterium]|nr:hypothetical protein [Saprospiraceae bacterium]